METELTKAQHYRDLASNMRELAAQEDNGEVRKTMLALADKYDELCRHLIDRLKSIS